MEVGVYVCDFNGNSAVNDPLENVILIELMTPLSSLTEGFLGNPYKPLGC